ncbi:hypothetical protein [Duganella radicis]|nr:hypothetical protein [Duganella radicis]
MYAALSSQEEFQTVRCGLGPPPGTSEFAAFNARRDAEVQRVGYETVCEANLARYDIGLGLLPAAVVLSSLDFRPVDLAATPFNSFPSVATVAETVSGVRSRLYRSFKMPDGHILTLFEDDMSADGTHVYRKPEDEPERVNGLPARLDVLQAPGGKAVSFISWVESRRSYELWLDANVVLEKRKTQLFALASSIPKSIPARTDEPQSAPVKLGPDGMPVFPEPPQFIRTPGDQR